MNLLLTIAGLLGAFATVGHFAIGAPAYLRPMLKASFDDVPRHVMHSVFHYVSTFMVLSAASLLALGLGVDLGAGGALLAQYIGLNYAVFTVVQLAIALTSGIPKPLTKMFQWVFFLLIAIFAWVGAA